MSVVPLSPQQRLQILVDNYVWRPRNPGPELPGTSCPRNFRRTRTIPGVIGEAAGKASGWPDRLRAAQGHCKLDPVRPILIAFACDSFVAFVRVLGQNDSSHSKFSNGGTILCQSLSPPLKTQAGG